MSNDREEMLQQMYKEQQMGKAARFNYVDLDVMERLGITQYKPEIGNNFIRIVSPTFKGYQKRPFYGKRVFKHQNIGSSKRTFLCMNSTYSKPCPVCEKLEEWKKAGVEKKIYSALFPMERCLFLVYDVSSKEKMDKGLMWFDAPKTFLYSLVDHSNELERGTKIIKKTYDFSDPKEGKDIEFKAEKKADYIQYEIIRLHDGQLDEALLKNIPNDFEELLIKPEYDEVKQEVNGMTESSNSVAEQPTNNTPAPQSSSAPSSDRFAGRKSATTTSSGTTSSSGLNQGVQERLKELGVPVD